jgi:hypothetical protein
MSGKAPASKTPAAAPDPAPTKPAIPPPIRFRATSSFNPFAHDGFHSAPAETAIEEHPADVPFPVVSHFARGDGIPHASLANVADLVDLSISDEFYLKKVPRTKALSARIPVPSSLDLPALPADPEGGSPPGPEWAQKLSAQVCIVARRYLDRSYGNRGYFIDFNNDRSLLIALRLLPELTKDEDPTSLKLIDTLTDSTNYCIRCEHFLVVISRWAKGSVYTSNWVEKQPQIPGPEKQTAFLNKLIYPDFRWHSPDHYPPQVFDPGPRFMSAPRTPEQGVATVLKEVGKQSAHMAGAGYPANSEAFEEAVKRCMPTVKVSMDRIMKRAAPTDFDERPDIEETGYNDYPATNYHGGSRFPDGHPPAHDKRRRSDQGGRGGGSGAPTTGTGHGGGSHGGSAGGGSAGGGRHVTFAEDPAPSAGGQSSTGVLYKKPSALYNDNAHPTVVQSILAVVHGSATPILEPDKVFRLCQAVGDFDSSQVLGLENIGGKQMIKAMTAKKSINSESDLISTLFVYQNSFVMALKPDVTHIAERWCSTLIGDINNMLQTHGLAVATEYLRHMVLQISINLREPVYEGGKLVGVDFHRDESALLGAVQRCATHARLGIAESRGRSGDRKTPREHLRDRADSSKSKAKPAPAAAPILPLSDRPAPASKTGAGPPAFAITQSIRDSVCTNNSKGFPCAFDPCPYDHSK